MKKSLLLMSLLLGLFVSVFALTACGDDDEADNNTLNSLAGTEWKYTYSDNSVVVEVAVKSNTVAHVAIKNSQGKVTEEYEYQYTYDGATGAGRAVTDDGQVVVFVVTGNIMTCLVDGDEVVFKRTK